MFLTGPRIVKRALGEEVTRRGSRRRRTCTTATASATSLPPTTGRRSRSARAARLPAAERGERRRCAGPRAAARRTTRRSCCRRRSRSYYDVRDADRGASSTAAASWRCSPRWARNMVVGFARLEGHPVGVVANQARHLRRHHRRGRPRRRAAKFIRTCDAVRPADARARGHARASCPGRRQEARGRDPPRRRAAAGVRRRHCAAGHGDRAQGLRRGVHHDELEGPRRRTRPSAGPRPRSAS